MTSLAHGGGASAPVRLDGDPFDPAALGIAHFEHHAAVSSTMDVAHTRAAAGAPHGTLIVADRQEAGRGRGGKRWHSDAPTGLWMTWLLRDVRVAALEVLSLRVGLAVADAVAPWADGVTGLKWPNDVLTAAAPSIEAARALPMRALAKLAGILVETRWREGQLEWVAIGVGINLQPPAAPGLAPAALGAGVSRAALIARIAAPLLTSVLGTAHLSDAEATRWRGLDLMRGRRATQPSAGLVAGVAPDGSLLVRGDDGVVREHRSGSLEVAP